MAAGSSVVAASAWRYAQTATPATEGIVLTADFVTRAEDSFFMAKGVVSIQIAIANTSTGLVSVIWDETAAILPDGTSDRVIHAGTRYIERDRPTPPTPIAPGSRIVDGIWPVSLVNWSGESWIESPIALSSGSSIGLYLTWQDASGKHSARWAWTFQLVQQPEPPPQPTPWYAKWWVWGLVLLVLGVIGNLGGSGS
jgi:hypothetical protein